LNEARGLRPGLVGEAPRDCARLRRGVKAFQENELVFEDVDADELAMLKLIPRLSEKIQGGNEDGATERSREG
jgi:hypothetical protein